MKAETKKLIITIINVLIFVGNAIVSFLVFGETFFSVFCLILLGFTVV